MTSKELNQRLILTFPELRDEFKQETEWQEGEDTGSHVVYGDVLVPAILFLLKGRRYDTVKKYFGFLEAFLAEGDEYATEVVVATVIESIAYDEVSTDDIAPLLGPLSRNEWDSYR
jgi:hypothetical protein